MNSLEVGLFFINLHRLVEYTVSETDLQFTNTKRKETKKNNN